MPSYYDKVFTFFENHGEPLLEVPKRPNLDLFAVDWGGDAIELHLNEVAAESPGPMTVREYAKQYFGGEQGYLDAYCCERDGIEVDFDAIQNQDMVETAWDHAGSPVAKAYRLLEDFDLGSDFQGEDAVGRLNFLDCPNMVSNYLGVQTEEAVSVSLLQKRLNDLNTGIRISMVEVNS